jgi:hypothetical protein
MEFSKCSHIGPEMNAPQDSGMDIYGVACVLQAIYNDSSQPAVAQVGEP